MFKLPEKTNKDLEDYRRYLGEFLDMKMSSARFTGIRVPWGIYSHRGGKIFMNRIRVPAGEIGSPQLKAIAHVSQEYGNGVAHITTRQDVQVHEVKIEDTIKVIDYLKNHDLSPRGGGGNTVRNITACPLSGVCPEELFDVRTHAISVSEYLLAEKTSFELPRKFKIAFSGCQKDCVGSLANDLGFLASRENGKRGFRVFVGGGMGAEPRLGKLLEEFIPEEDIGYVVEAAKNVFHRHGDRKNKHRNRLRFLVENMGLEEFRNAYCRELRELKENEPIVLRSVEIDKDVNPDRNSSRPLNGERIPQTGDEEFEAFLEYNVRLQKQEGFASIELRIPQGDITARELSDLADLEKDFEGIAFRTSFNQNIFLCWVRCHDLYKLFLRLKEMLKDFLHPETLLDVVACKGALTCNLGLCNSPGLSRAIEDVIKDEFSGTTAFKNLDIKINGCPNACGQHPLGKLSFYGMVRRVDNRPVPFYKFLLGGRKEGDRSALAKEIGIIPARNVPDFLRLFLKRIEPFLEEKKELFSRSNDELYDIVLKKGGEIAAAALKEFSHVPVYAENRDFYIDWGRTEPFSLEGLGPGECGAGIISMIEADLEEGKTALEEAEKDSYSAQEIRKALFFSSRCLLVVKGQDPRNEEEVFSLFRRKFIEEGIASDNFSNTGEIFENTHDDLSLGEKKEKFLYARDFLAHVNQLYQEMDSSFNFPLKREKPKEAAARRLDLKGVRCPINYVKAKLFLEDLPSGEIVELFLDEGEPIDNVPRSLQGDGHKIVTIEKEDEYYRVVVKKAA